MLDIVINNVQIYDMNIRIIRILLLFNFMTYMRI